jgi:hypothetical protein
MYDGVWSEGERAMKKLYWVGKVGLHDDFGDPITTTFIDGRTVMGPWAIMSPMSWVVNGVGRLGTGFGQKYEKQDGGKWLKVEG